jgi:hypothetical protein
LLNLNPTSDAPPRVVRVPLFNMLAQRLQRGGRWVILDFGPAHSGTVAFCNRFRCRLEVADLARDLGSLNELDDPAEFARHAEAILPPPRGDPPDIVFCWDLLNYLRRPALTALMDRVAARARAGAMIHALIVYSAARMPARPGAYQPVFDPDGVPDQETLLVRSPDAGDDRDAPRYTPDDLRRCLPAYRLDRGTLLSNGLQEFLFRL